MDEVLVVRVCWVGLEGFAFFQVQANIGAAVKLAVFPDRTHFGTHSARPAVLYRQFLMELSALHRIQFGNCRSW